MSDEHYLTDYRTEGGIRVVVYVPKHVPQVQPDKVMDRILHATVRLADEVDEALGEAEDDG